MAKIGIILGTRPEIIKLSPIIRAFVNQHIPYFLIHTGQHYSYELDQIFFDELKLPQPTYNLHVGSGNHGEQTGRMLIGIESIIIKEKPDMIIVLGDPNSALAGALTAVKLHIPVCHLEAGRRSYNRNMPEEINRLLIDHIADYLFTPNEDTKKNLLHEGLSENQIIITGDPIVSTVLSNQKIAAAESSILSLLNVSPKRYFLVTVHRPENVDDRLCLTSILHALQVLSKQYQLPVLFPVHPRTRKMIENYQLSTEGINVVSPLGYLDFLRLETDALVILTDSGCVQEEACILRVPCVTLRSDTERQETVVIGANVLAGTKQEDILSAVAFMKNSNRTWSNPFGDSDTEECIIQEIICLCRK